MTAVAERRIKPMYRVALLLLLVLGSVLPARADDSRGEQAIGFYAKGSLESPSRLEDDGIGFLKIFRSRDRGYGSQDLISFLVGLGTRVLELHPEGERIQIGDLSGPRGGYISGHSSHQNGLDVDTSFLRVDRREQNLENESGFDEAFVQGGRLTPNFDLERNWSFFASAAATGRVQRMFVDPAIKRTYCKSMRDIGPESVWPTATVETLRRLRPYPNHDDHIHFRLYCPAGSGRCKEQEEVAPGSGCSELMPPWRKGGNRRAAGGRDEHGDRVAF